MTSRDGTFWGVIVVLLWLFFRPASSDKNPAPVQGTSLPSAGLPKLPLEPLLPNPVQTGARRQQPWNVREIQFKSLAHYEITARVVSKHDYFDAGLTELAPFDLGLVWGRVADPAIYPTLRFSQEGRFLRWHLSRELGMSGVESQSYISNVHMIPANDHTRALITAVQVGGVLTAKGELVEARDLYAGTWWRSSLVRTDTGDGACEVMWVESVELQ